jgi:hypothetical protein
VEHVSKTSHRPRRFSGRRILVAISIVPWMYLTWSGYDLCYGPRVSAVSGYPNQEQLHLYVVTPVVGLIVNIALFAAANKLSVWLHWIVAFIQALTLATVLARWGGGM